MTTIRSAPIQSAAVLGAGTMGAQIAAHLANAGIPTRLLDLTRDTARDGLKRAQALKPDPFFTPDAASLISPGGFDTDADLDALADADWIIEAIVERLDVKQQLLARVEPRLKPAAIVSSNTSGIPIAAIAEGRSEAFRRRWLGTHFFNPPRYLPLLELIPTADTDPDVVSALAAFADARLGKGVVLAKDTPNFIANRVGLFGVLRLLEALAGGSSTGGGYTIEEVDAMTGPAIGRPKSATFRTVDLTGIDLIALVSGNLRERLAPEEAKAFELPPIVQALVERGWLGEKTGQGFYKRERGPAGASEILTLDPETMTYRARQSPRLAALEAAKAIEDPRERLRTLFLGRDRVGEFLRATLGPTLLYAVRVAPEIASSIDDVDRAMAWGFGWDLGPFEACDAIGLRELLEACGVAGNGSVGGSAADGGARDGAPEAPPLIREQLDRQRNTFRDGDHRVPPPAGALLFRDATSGCADGASRTLVKTNAGASLIDLGDGVLGLELHSKLNTIGGDTIAMLNAGVKEAERNFAALIVATDAVNFSVGANLMLLLLEAQEGNWEEIDLMVRAFQQATMALRLAPVPVIVCPTGMTLGGGCEIALHGDRVRASAETYMGLVEVGVGLIPAGGGTKEMVARATEGRGPGAGAPASGDLLPAMQRVFETIGFAKASTSAAHARQLGYLRATDRITMNRDRLIADAKITALRMVGAGYRPVRMRTAIPVGGASLEAALKLGVHLALRAGRISEHDALIGRKLAHIIAGGSLPQAATVGEQYLLDLEREAFLSLCGERKTLERIQHTLKTGKPLRN
jgi:3-hydroxyacyl-CoA dehydrogenase